MKIFFLSVVLFALISGGNTSVAAENVKTTKTESFDRDPHWDAFRNWVTPERIPTVSQDFGFSPTHFAGRESGEMGGRIQRATTPAFYAAKIPPRTLNDKLTASGTFTITQSTGNSGLFFGWFNAQQPGGGRPVSSLGMDMDAENSGGRLAVRMISSANKSCGTFITPFVPGKFRPTPLKHNVRYRWMLSYDPAANNGNGRFEFKVAPASADGTGLSFTRSEPPKKNAAGHIIDEEWEGKTFTADVPEHIRKEGATFDRFGLMNMGRSGSTMTIYFDDLEFDGRREDFSRDPNWEGSGNRITYQESMPAGAQRFGLSPETSFAGGKAGEIGGAFWRGETTFGYYADRVGPFTLEDRLEASGKVVLQIGAPDSGMMIGWFKSTHSEEPPEKDFLAVAVSGPTRIGHYFNPVLATADGTKRHPEAGPVIVPGKIYEWKMVYDPAANKGLGSIEVKLGNESVTLNLKEGDKARGAFFDRFGLFSSAPGGGLVKIYFDDFKYSVAR